MKQYASTIYRFKEINPLKKYAQFTFTDINFNEVTIGYCNKGEILRIEGKYYLYAGDSELITDEKQREKILFLKGKKTIKLIHI